MFMKAQLIFLLIKKSFMDIFVALKQESCKNDGEIAQNMSTLLQNISKSYDV